MQTKIATDKSVTSMTAERPVMLPDGGLCILNDLSPVGHKDDATTWSIPPRRRNR
jgi:hypothetical protein